MADESRSQVLVTGGTGFIGRRLVRALLKTGAEVTVADKRAFPEHDLKSGLATGWPEFSEAAQ